MDNKSVIVMFHKSPRSNIKQHGILWQAIYQAKHDRFLRGGGKIVLIWIGSHNSLEASLRAGACELRWVANQLADALASRAAQEAILPIAATDAVQLEHTTAISILRRLVCIAIAIIPEQCNRSRTSIQHVKSKGKQELVAAWAKAAGHSLSPNYKCVRCSLQVNMAFNTTALEGILTMPCVGSLNQSFVRHPNQADDDGVLLFNNIEAHSSHAMATSGALQLHFCVSCGCYGSSRSNRLRHPCSHKATKAGRAALAAIAAGRKPKLSEAGKGSKGGQSEAKQKETFSKRVRLPFSPWPEGSACSETGTSPKVKKPRSEQNLSPQESVGTYLEGSPKTDRSSDQIGDVCLLPRGHVVPGERPSSAWPLGAEVAPGPSFLSSCPSRNSLGVRDCIRRNGLCPREGWTIASYCPVCHG